MVFPHFDRPDRSVGGVAGLAIREICLKGAAAMAFIDFSMRSLRNMLHHPECAKGAR